MDIYRLKDKKHPNTDNTIVCGRASEVYNWQHASLLVVFSLISAFSLGGH